MSSSAPCKKSQKELGKLLFQKELFLFDLDGVLRRGKKPLPYAKELLAHLIQIKKRPYILTNNSTRTPRSVARALRQMGLPVQGKNILTPVDALRDYLVDQKSLRTLYIIGERGLVQPLRPHFQILPPTVPVKKPPDAVVVGRDSTFTFAKLALAQRYLLQGALYYATNLDPTYPAEDGLEPGAGALVAALTACTGKKPITFGKPSSELARYLQKRLPLPKKKWLLIGDRLDTDMAFAKQMGIHSLLVLTGVESKKSLASLGEKTRYLPDGVFPDLSPLLEAL